MFLSGYNLFHDSKSSYNFNEMSDEEKTLPNKNPALYALMFSSKRKLKTTDVIVTGTNL